MLVRDLDRHEATARDTMRNRFPKQLTPPAKQLACPMPCSRATCDAVQASEDAYRKPLIITAYDGLRPRKRE